MELTKETSREHFNKYAALSEHIPNHLGYTKESLERKFIHDSNLNDIPLFEFDSFYYRNRVILTHKNLIPLGFSLAENTCLMKHILLYRVLNVKPVFS